MNRPAMLIAASLSLAGCNAANKGGHVGDTLSPAADATIVKVEVEGPSVQSVTVNVGRDKSTKGGGDVVADLLGVEVEHGK